MKFFSSIFRFNKIPENTENNLPSEHRSCRRNEEKSDEGLDFDIDLDDSKEDDNQID